PFELQRVCREHGLNFPETRASAEGLPLDGSWLCKTYRGSNGSGVWPHSHSAAADANRTACVYQKHMFGTPASATFCSDTGGARLLGVTEQIVNAWQLHAPDWAYCGSIYRADLLERFAKEVGDIGQTVCGEFSLRGLVGVDLLFDYERFWLIEVNPRFTASVEVVESHRPAAAVAEHASCFGADPAKEDVPSPRCLAGRAVLFADQEANVEHSLAQLLAKSASAGRVADIPEAGSVICRGKPVLTVLWESDDADSYWTRKALFESAARIDSRLKADQDRGRRPQT
ncbi:MAG: ATP-grasp domain-containing protein, partial [Planctomycetota bacterium]